MKRFVGAAFQTRFALMPALQIAAGKPLPQLRLYSGSLRYNLLKFISTVNIHAFFNTDADSILTLQTALLRKTIRNQYKQQADDAYGKRRVEGFGAPGGIWIKALHHDAESLEKKRRADLCKKFDAGHGGTRHLGRHELFDLGVNQQSCGI